MTENLKFFAAKEGAMNVPICPNFNVIFSRNTFTAVDSDQDKNAHQKMGATRPDPSQSCLFYCGVGTDRVCLVVSVITIMSVVRLFTAVYKFYHTVDLLHAVCAPLNLNGVYFIYIPCTSKKLRHLHLYF